MKKFYLGLAIFGLFSAFMGIGLVVRAESRGWFFSTAASTTLTISQVGQGGGGATGTYLFDYVEIKNISNANQSLNGLSLSYGSATGVFGSSSATNTFALPNVSLNPGQYYLVQLGTAGTAGAALPVTPDATSTGLAMQGNSGKIALVTSNFPQNTCGSAAAPCNGTQLAQIIDWVAYGAAGNGTAGNGEGGTATNNGVGLATTQGSVRKTGGCTDSDNNNADFDIITNPVPRNTSSTLAPCIGGPTPTPTVTPTPTPSGSPTPTPSVTPTPTPSPTPTPGTGSTSIVISQFQTGGGTADDEFVELHNVSSSPVDLNGNVLVYRSATGSSDVGPFASWTTSTILQPGQYYLVASTNYDGGITPDITYNPSVCSCSMGGAGGGLALRPSAGATPIDKVGWGTATNIFVETTVTAAPPTNDSRSRLNSGCKDTDNNSQDFGSLSPAVARNRSTPVFVCNGGGPNMFAGISASPSTVPAGTTTLFTVNVTPATTPPSTGISVIGNLSTIGGSASQQFFDDGTNGDATAGDKVFSYLATIPGGTANGPYNITAIASDAQARSVNLNYTITVGVPTPTPTPTPVPTPDPNENPLLFGNPSNATADIANENNYLMVKPQYTLSYNRSKETPNWTAWHLDSSWIGNTGRVGDFAPDTTLPSGWYQVTPADYSEPVYDRGHMCPSGDRTNTDVNNFATFLMTNMVPQLPDNNQGPWADLENYCRTLAQSGNELYIISGPQGNIGTIGNGVVIPAVTWKVVLVLPNGSDDLSRITRSTRAFGVIMSNQAITRNAPWRNFRVTVDTVERLTGYDFFTAIPKNTQELIERKHDIQ